MDGGHQLEVYRLELELRHRRLLHMEARARFDALLEDAGACFDPLEGAYFNRPPFGFGTPHLERLEAARIEVTLAAERVAAAEQELERVRWIRDLPVETSPERIRAWKRARILLEGDSGAVFGALSWAETYGPEASAVCALGNQHRVPDVGCSCGFYAMKDRSRLAPTGTATLELELEGRVVVGSRGYRAATQRVLVGYLDDRCTGGCGATASCLREAIEITPGAGAAWGESLTFRKALVPWCGSCGWGELSPAGVPTPHDWTGGARWRRYELADVAGMLGGVELAWATPPEGMIEALGTAVWATRFYARTAQLLSPTAVTVTPTRRVVPGLARLFAVPPNVIYADGGVDGDAGVDGDGDGEDVEAVDDEAPAVIGFADALRWTAWRARQLLRQLGALGRSKPAPPPDLSTTALPGPNDGKWWLRRDSR